jgi:hypothetical protein
MTTTSPVVKDNAATDNAQDDESLPLPNKPSR